MSMLRSLAYSLKEVRYRPLAILHGLGYAATVTYLRALALLVRNGSDRFRQQVVDTYHGKVVKLADARKIITVDRNIELRNLEQIIPYATARDLVLINPDNIAVYECPCRAMQSEPCRPTEVCLIVGEPFADLVRLCQPLRSRRISRHEALQILEEEDRRGHIHTAWFKNSMLGRFYAICNCCKCCCLGMKFMQEYGMKMLQPSGYRAVVGAGCVGCGTCTKFCQFGALEVTADDSGRRCRVDAGRCYGCGVCSSKCPKGQLELVLAPETGIPLDITALADASMAGQA